LAGFTTGVPWLPIANDFKTTNVACLREQPTSILNLYRRLLELRRSEAALCVGDYAAVPAGEDLITYIRKSADRRFLIALNFAAQTRSFDVSELLARPARIRLSTCLDRAHEQVENELSLRGNEGVIIELS